MDSVGTYILGDLIDGADVVVGQKRYVLEGIEHAVAPTRWGYKDRVIFHVTDAHAKTVEFYATLVEYGSGDSDYCTLDDFAALPVKRVERRTREIVEWVPTS